MRRTAIRERIYTLLLSQPRKVWTVRQVTDALASGGRVSDDMVRPVLYVLLADHIMVAVSGSRALTLTLSSDGLAALRAIMTNWPAEPSHAGRAKHDAAPVPRNTGRGSVRHIRRGRGPVGPNSP